jgi:hypothetical protein
MRRLLVWAALAIPSQALADDVDETMKALGVEETEFVVADKRQTKLALPDSDESTKVDLPFLSTQHRDEGQAYLDPFVGREVFPELSAQLSTQLVRQKLSNRGEPNGNNGRVALGGRVDFNLWLLDVRVPFDTTDDSENAPLELVAKAPFSLGEHHFAPMLIAHVPTDDGIDDSVIELAFGYHYARSGFALKLEVSGFVGTHERRKGDRIPAGAIDPALRPSAGMFGWNGVVSYLIGDVVGIVFEADGVTAISERAEFTSPSAGDTLVTLAPGLRFFPVDPGFSLGLAAVITLVPDDYVGVPRDLGVLFDFGYTFL